MSMFLGLRGMANLPVESMMVGGVGWFEDLTLRDPFYVLPLVTAATMGLQIKLGVDGMGSQAVGPIMRKVQYAIPAFITMFTFNFPAVRLDLRLVLKETSTTLFLRPSRSTG